MVTARAGTEAALRAVIDRFLQERLDAKLEKLPSDDPRREALTKQFEPANWIADAARRVSQIQVVTHSLKPIHPDARGTNLYVAPRSLPQYQIVGSHVLADNFQADVVGNAAALDVYKFLRLEHSGKSLLELALEDDQELAEALNDDPKTAQSWLKAFAGIVQPRGDAASHTKGKQLYWLAGDDPTNDADFHLLAPLYATSLTQRVYEIINEDRFGDSAKAARTARRENRMSESGYRDYPNLAVQKLGGTKPQNISQLNSERRGYNYLLASLPPNWQSRAVPTPLRIETIFNRFGTRPAVRSLVQSLRQFLQSDPARTLHTRNRRAGYTTAIIDELVLFQSEIKAGLEPGWSEHGSCRLPEPEKLWLDPRRADIDEAFARQWRTTDWPTDICHRFANWLNNKLMDALPVGDAEYRHWSAMLEQELDCLREVLRDA